MILINLLPYHLRPVKRSPLPYIGSVAIVVVAALAILTVYMGILADVAAAKKKLEDTKAALAELEDTVNEFNALNAQKQSLQERILIIKDILSDRIIWSQQLHNLARLTPKNIWYSGIRVTSRRVQQEVLKLDKETGKPVINPKTNQPQMEKQTVIRPVLEVSGYIIANEQGVANLYDLAENTEGDPEFSRMFQLIGPQLEDTEFEGYAVRGFTLEYEIRPQGEPSNV